MIVKFFLYIGILALIVRCQESIPLVLNTWAFTNATSKAWKVLNDNVHSGLDALVEGCSVCERQQCDGTVGYGGSPDERGETTLDAMIIDGSNMNIGAVAALRRVKDAIAVARYVLDHTQHTLLVGDSATDFAKMMGFQVESLSTPESQNIYHNWKDRDCQPNFWMNVVPNPKFSCGPYAPALYTTPEAILIQSNSIRGHEFGSKNHDTIGMIVIDKNGNIVAGTSTNGARHKIPGRVGDSPIPGAGAYADNSVGAAVATGDGDIMMRFLPSFLAVEGLRSGLNPSTAGSNAIKRIINHYPEFVGGIVVASRTGEYAASCHGMKTFPFSVYQMNQTEVKVEYVDCVEFS